MSNLLSFAASASIVYFLIVFIVFSYGIVGIMTWSFIKPLKYLGFPTIATGMLCLFTKTLFGFLSLGEGTYTSLIDMITSSGSAFFFKSGIIIIIIGIIMEAIYFSIKYIIKQKNSSIDNEA